MSVSEVQRLDTLDDTGSARLSFLELFMLPLHALVVLLLLVVRQSSSADNFIRLGMLRCLLRLGIGAM